MSRIGWLGPLLVISLWGQDPLPRPAHAASSAEEQAVVRELMKIRMFPRDYAKYLRSLGSHFQGTLPQLQVAGAAIGWHQGYAAMTVVDLADAFAESR